MYSPNTHTHTHTNTVRAVFSRQKSEKWILNFHVISGPRELVYRAKNQSCSFNYRLSVASQCVATSLNRKWDETGTGIKARERERERERDLKLSSLAATVYLLVLHADVKYKMI